MSQSRNRCVCERTNKITCTTVSTTVSTTVDTTVSTTVNTTAAAATAEVFTTFSLYTFNISKLMTVINFIFFFSF